MTTSPHEPHAPHAPKNRHTPAYAASGGAETRLTPAYGASGVPETRHTPAYGGFGAYGTGAGAAGVRFGYGSNGFANHRLRDALGVIADLGYVGVALTLDHAHLDPFAADLPRQVDEVRAELGRRGLGVVIETGARYLLDPRRKHHPTLVCDDGREARVDLLRRAVRIAADLGAECVSFWSGTLPPATDADTGWQRLADGVSQVLEEAQRYGVPLGLEPEPGMFIERLDHALALRERLGKPELLRITLDVGHCVAVEPLPAADCVRLAGELLVNVQLDDMRPQVHEHLEFGAGSLDLPATIGALAEVGYRGLAAVELPRHSHAAPEVAARAITALRGASWLVTATARVRAQPFDVRTLFPAAGRHCGRGPRRPASDPAGLVYGSTDDAARVALLAALGTVSTPDELAAEVGDLYRYGDDAEKRGVLRGLSTVDGVLPVRVGLECVQDALRSNDIRLVAAALGDYAADHLDQHGWRHGVLKCLFVGVPLAAVAGLDRRADAELRRMVSDFATERRAAGRPVPADALALLATGPQTRLTPAYAASGDPENRLTPAYGVFGGAENRLTTAYGVFGGMEQVQDTEGASG